MRGGALDPPLFGAAPVWQSAELDGDVVQTIDDQVAAHQRKLVETARSYLHVREVGRNRGPDVERFLRSVGLGPGHPWCAAGIYAVCAEAAAGLGGTTECPRTASAVAIYRSARRRGLLTFTAKHARQRLIFPQPGDIFVRVRLGAVQDVGSVLVGRRRKGHCGMVTGLRSCGNIFRTVEFNANIAGDREGDGVYEREVSLSMRELVGFVRLPPPVSFASV